MKFIFISKLNINEFFNLSIKLNRNLYYSLNTVAITKINYEVDFVYLLIVTDRFKIKYYWV